MSCGKRASETSTVPKDKTCSDCLSEVSSYLARHSLQGAVLTEANERIYEECMDILLSLTKSLDGNSRKPLTKEAMEHMREAGEVLSTALRHWIVSILAKTASTHVDGNRPRYILLRANSADAWTVKDYKWFVFDHVRAGIP